VDGVEGPCPRCSGPTRVQKSIRRHVVTLAHGGFVAQETVRVCASGCAYPSGRRVTLHSSSLAERVAPGATYGYDLEVHVGLARFVHHLQREEIRRELKVTYGIELSSGQTSLLAGRFLRHLEALHRSRAAVLRAALAQDGGYPLHIDATGENGRGTLFVAYAGWRGWVLGSWKIVTERADQIVPRLREVRASFGVPCAIVRDLGRAVILAAKELVAEIEQDVPVLSCHLHFLKDVGEDLMESSYDQLRRLFRRFAVRAGLHSFVRDLGRRLDGQSPALRDEVASWAEDATEHILPAGSAGLTTVRSLALWILDYPCDGHHLGFPFDRPYLDLYERCRTVRRATDAFRRRPIADRTVRRSLQRLARILDAVVSDATFAQVVNTLAERASLFDQLRDVLRLTPRSEPKVLSEAARCSSEQAVAELRDIEKTLGLFTRSLRKRRPERGPAQSAREAIDLVLDHLDRHGGSLFGHIIHLPEEAGGGIRLVDRTNNQEEGLFHGIKHRERRRSGRKVLSHDFEHLPGPVALACNLTRPDYVQLVCGSLAELPCRFAELDLSRRTNLLETLHADMPWPLDQAQTIETCVAKLDRRFVRTTHLRRRIEAAARSRAPHQAVAVS